MLSILSNIYIFSNTYFINFTNCANRPKNTKIHCLGCHLQQLFDSLTDCTALITDIPEMGVLLATGTQLEEKEELPAVWMPNVIRSKHQYAEM